MRSLQSLAFSMLAFLLLSGPLNAQSVPHAFKGAHIIPINSKPIDNGVLIVKDGKIVAVGGSNTSIPSNAVVHDATGKVIMPGLIDTHSHIGEGDGGDRSSALHADVRIYDTIDPRSNTFKKALAGGITSVNVMPGSGHLMSGQTVYLKLRKANTIDEMLLVVDEENNIYGGMKMANGTNPRRAAPFPGTRAKAAAMVRAMFVKAQEYQAKVADAKGDESKLPPRDLEMEALVQILEGKRIVHNHTHRHDDILTAIRLSQEFGYRLVLHHVSEAHRVADEIAAAGIPSSIITLDSFGGKMEAINLLNINGAALEKAGALVGLHTDDGITDSRLFLRSAAMMVRDGMSREKALEAVTIANSKMMDIEDRTGTLEKGKDADFILLSGDPFSVYTHIEQTWIEGQKVWDRSNPEDKEYATGGYEIFRTGFQNHHQEEN
ncbi:MAG: amidohydrolase family protein [Balneolaceae bacterium]